MLFSSITFIYYFLPITLILYFYVPVGYGERSLRRKNSLLLVASFLFYAMGEPKYVFLMMGSVLSGYIGGRILGRFPKKWVVVCFVTLQVSLLGVFKYTDFLIGTWNQVTGSNASFLYLILPIGISFYSFQIISYLVDVFRQNLNAEKSFINFAAYITMFPQLIAGPIVRYEVVQPQMLEREISLRNVSDGATRFLVGLGKKVLIADNLGEMLLRIESVSDKSVWSYWLIAVMYTLQIYHDFSGYSDMAIGLGKMLGFYFPENFNYPMISRSITEFWRRWHISLGTFLKDYIYIPLGGSRCSMWRWILNILIVWFVSGLWHGASWNFVFWGLYFGVFLVVEKLWKTGRKESNVTVHKKFVGVCIMLLQNIYMWIVVVISFVLFRFTDITKGKDFLAEMFRFRNITVSAVEWYEYQNVGVLLWVGIIGSTPIMSRMVNWVLDKMYTDDKKQIIRVGIALCFQMVMLIVVTAFLIQSSVHPFLYFRF